MADGDVLPAVVGRAGVKVYWSPELEPSILEAGFGRRERAGGLCRTRAAASDYGLGLGALAAGVRRGLAVGARTARVGLFGWPSRAASAAKLAAGGTTGWRWSTYAPDLGEEIWRAAVGLLIAGWRRPRYRRCRRRRASCGVLGVPGVRRPCLHPGPRALPTGVRRGRELSLEARRPSTVWVGRPAVDTIR